MLHDSQLVIETNHRLVFERIVKLCRTKHEPTNPSSTAALGDHNFKSINPLAHSLGLLFGKMLGKILLQIGLLLRHSQNKEMD